MTYRFQFEDDATATVNLAPDTIEEAIFNLKRALKAAGWTVPMSSDGLTYNASGDQITVAGSGAGGLANDLAWFVLEEPGGRAQWCFQRIAAVSTPDGSTWRIKVGSLDKFEGGTPGITRTPSTDSGTTTTDQMLLLGGGTDASPTGARITNLEQDEFIQHIGCDEDAPYGWYCVFVEDGATSVDGLIFQDPMIGGSYPPVLDGAAVAGDPDPVVYQAAQANCNAQRTAAAGPQGRVGNSGPVRTRLAYALLECGDGGVITTVGVDPGLSANPYSGYDEVLPVGVYRAGIALAAPHGWKGWSSLWRVVTNERAIGDAAPLVDTDDVEVERRLVLDDQFSVPFPVGVAVTV